jgi:hypothetical protein
VCSLSQTFFFDTETALILHRVCPCDYRKKSVLVVCHSVVVLIFRRLLERWNEDEYLKIDREQDVLNCSMTAFRYDAKMGKLLLGYYNVDFHFPIIRLP